MIIRYIFIKIIIKFYVIINYYQKNLINILKVKYGVMIKNHNHIIKIVYVIKNIYIVQKKYQINNKLYVIIFKKHFKYNMIYIIIL